MTAGQSARPLPQPWLDGRAALLAVVVAAVVFTAVILAIVWLTGHAAATIVPAAPVHLPNGLLPGSVPDTTIAHPVIPQ